jgi:hypothetical protein
MGAEVESGLMSEEVVKNRNPDDTLPFRGMQIEIKLALRDGAV